MNPREPEPTAVAVAVDIGLWVFERFDFARVWLTRRYERLTEYVSTSVHGERRDVITHDDPEAEAKVAAWNDARQCVAVNPMYGVRCCDAPGHDGFHRFSGPVHGAWVEVRW